jgi:hypothetical protein
MGDKDKDKDIEAELDAELLAAGKEYDKVRTPIIATSPSIHTNEP